MEPLRYLAICTFFILPILFSGAVFALDKQISVTEHIETQNIIDASYLGQLDKDMVLFDEVDKEVLVFQIDPRPAFVDSHPEAFFYENIVNNAKFLPREKNDFFFKRTSFSEGLVETSYEFPLFIRVQASPNRHLIKSEIIGRDSKNIFLQQFEMDQGGNNSSAHLIVYAVLSKYNISTGSVSKHEKILQDIAYKESPFFMTLDNRAFFISPSGRIERVSFDGLEKITFDSDVFGSSYADQSEIVRKNSPTYADSSRDQKISRNEIINRANAFLEVDWILSESNYSKKRNSNCKTGIWRRPNYLNKELYIGSKFDKTPYKWGGYDSKENILNKLNAGSVAGDTCTCRCKKNKGCTLQDWCIDKETVGLDCSGFVSEVWNISYHSTRTLPDVSKTIQWDRLKPGDILNKENSHVMLFSKFVNDEHTQLEIIDSSIECGGVCKRSVSMTELNGYSPRRYNKVMEVSDSTLKKSKKQALYAYLDLIYDKSNPNPSVIGGKAVDPSEYASTFYFSSDRGMSSNCGASLIDKHMLVTAAHCVDNGEIVDVYFQGNKVTSKCKTNPEFEEELDKSADWAVCISKKPIFSLPTIPIASLDEFIKSDKKVELAGFGCTNPDRTGGRDRVLRSNFANIINVPTNKSEYIILKGDTVLCSGDSGGPAFIYVNNLRKLVGINSKTNHYKTSYVSNLFSKRAMRFLDYRN